MSNLSLFLSLVVLLLGVVVSMLFYSMFSSNVEDEIQPLAICGNFLMYAEVTESDSINTSIGKTLFNNNCASCHNRNMKDKMTGPALSGSIARFGNDTLRYFEYVRSPNLYLSKGLDPRMDSVHKEFGVIKPNFEDLTLNELESIILYISKVYY